MSLQLSKGGNLALSKVTTDTTLQVGLSWDENKDSTIKEPIDIDVFGIIVDDNNRGCNDSLVRFYNNVDGSGLGSNTAYNGLTQEDIFKKAKELLKNSVCVITKDELTGASDGDDETLFVNTSLMVPSKKLILAVNIYEAIQRKQLFGMVKNAVCKVYDSNQKELFKMDLGEDFSLETGVIVGEFYLNGTECKFRALAEGFEGDLNQLIQKYK